MNENTALSTVRDIEIYRAMWRDIELEIRFERHWPISTFAMAHLEVEAIKPRHAALPITETGYRSHFLGAEAIDCCGGVVAYVMVALNLAAKDRRWKARQLAARQLSLF
jgi:hypothetical protein